MVPVIIVGSVCIMCTVDVRKVIVILWIYVDLCIQVLLLFLFFVGKSYIL